MLRLFEFNCAYICHLEAIGMMNLLPCRHLAENKLVEVNKLSFGGSYCVFMLSFQISLEFEFAIWCLICLGILVLQFHFFNDCFPVLLAWVCPSFDLARLVVCVQIKIAKVNYLLIGFVYFGMPTLVKIMASMCCCL